ncbi:MAG: nucleotidyltransferase family protein [Solibacillus sp.]
MVKVGAIILAAGKSSRMGEPKLLLPFRESPLVASAVSVALQQLQLVVCVTGAYKEWIQQALASYGDAIEIHHNPHFDSGMASSLKIGIQALHGRVDAVIIFLGDQPFVSGEVVASLIQHYCEAQARGIKIVRPVYAQQPGHPILFDCDLFKAFESLGGDVGAKSIIARHKDQLELVHFQQAEWGVDIDTPADYVTLLKKG